MTGPAGTARADAGRARVAALAALLALAGALGCTTPSTHPELVRADARAERPPLLPVRRFVANVDWVGNFALSPDGTRLMNTETVGTDLGIAVRDAASGAVLARYPVGNQGRGGG